MREAKGLSQGRLARLADVANNTIIKQILDYVQTEINEAFLKAQEV